MDYILGFDLDDGTSPGDSQQANPQEARKLFVQRFVQSFEHARGCRDANCRRHVPSCQEMKKFLTHVQVCKLKTNRNCSYCKQLDKLLCYHANNCQETECPASFCTRVKQELNIQNFIQSFTHAWEYRDVNCRRHVLSCQNMKMVVNHTKACKRKTNGGCSVCKQLKVLICHHAKYCQEYSECPVPYCNQIAYKLEQQQLQQQKQLQQTQLLRRMMHVIHIHLPHRRWPRLIWLGPNSYGRFSSSSWRGSSLATGRGIQGTAAGAAVRPSAMQHFLQRSLPPAPSPRPPTPSEMMLLHQSPSPPPLQTPDKQLPQLSPQDQLTKFVEQL